MESKYLVGILFLGLAGLAYFFISNLTDLPIIGFLVDVGGLVVGIVMGVFGLLIMLMGQEAMKWLVLTAVVGIVALVLWIVPDPIPFIDELVTSVLTLFFMYKAISSGQTTKKVAKF